MKDNRGISLVEMIVTVAVLAIVASILASILGMALKFYSSEHMDTSLQYESQLALNTVSNNIMQAQGIAIINDSNDLTEQLCLGEFTQDGAVYKYTGIVIFGEYSTDMKLYITEFTDETLSASDIIAAVQELETKFNGYTEDQKKAALLAQNVESMRVVPTSDKIIPVTEDDGSITEYFTNPFSVDIKMVFSGASQGGIETQSLNDTIMIRNKLKQIVYTDTIMKEE